jgi:uncharacterized DUF497 family protein
MEYEWDPEKSARNWAARRISFKSARRFDWTFALEARDGRQAYEEVRTIALGFIGERLHVLVYTRRGIRCRVISLRKAHPREAARYAKFTEDLG